MLDVQEGPGAKAATTIGGGTTFAKCDVTSEEEVNAAMESARAAMGGINLLVNCAGVIGAGRVLGKNGPMAGDFFSKVVHINLIGTFLCDKAAAAIMQTNAPNADGERGVIIHTSSVAAYEGQIGQAAYAVAKAGVVGMTLSAARDLSAVGVRVNTIAPGTMKTPIMESVGDEALAKFAASVPFPKRLGAPDEYADAAVFLLANRYLNGEVLRLDGAQRFAPR